MNLNWPVKPDELRPGHVIVKTCCPFCDKQKDISVPQEQYAAWRLGALAHHAFVGLNEGDVERIISGTCDACWDEQFKEEEEA